LAERNVDLPRDRRIEFRVGIHVGDIIIDRDDIYGDGVNVAARLEGLAEPGGICVSGRVHEDVQGKIDVAFEDVGEQQLKNINRSVRVYRARPSGAAASSSLTLRLPDKPSIAVLPFQNISGDPEQDYFADGVVEEITTALSRFRQLFVIARNSSFTYKGRSIDVKQVGRELGVRYVLEGSVRKAANRLRITGQLIDALTGAHLWADRVDGGLEDIFDLQDNVTASVVGAIAPKVEQAEIERAKHKPTENLVAYDYYLRGMANLYRTPSRETLDEALRLFNRAIELDQGFGSAYGAAASCYSDRKTSGWTVDRDHEIAEATRLARRAADFGKDDAVALSYSGFALAYLARDLDAGIGCVDRALILNPNLALAWFTSGWLRVWLGKPDIAIDHLTRAMRLSPLDPYISGMRVATAHAHFFAGRHEEASFWAGMALRESPDFHAALRIAAASNALAGHALDAAQAVARLRELDSALRLSNFRDVVLGPYRRREDLTSYDEGLRKAGLPE
jgi:TolB-like protein